MYASNSLFCACFRRTCASIASSLARDILLRRLFVLRPELFAEFFVVSWQHWATVLFGLKNAMTTSVIIMTMTIIIIIMTMTTIIFMTMTIIIIRTMIITIMTIVVLN
ncbi:hypothetical protein FHG87_004757 [Trinorchestia longiramus]|nr:hypothetical protein FHG87_004757 [Trinorchestia longiramus]